MKVAIIGATGYTGLELVRILLNHPEVHITALTSERFSGQDYSSVFPSLRGIIRTSLETLNIDKIIRKADFIFTAVPHKEAMDIVPQLIEKDKKVVDLSADFRFKQPSTYEKWYHAHSSPELLSQAVYGLPEINRKKIRYAALVSNPGCYPTSVIMPLVPLLKEDIISTRAIIVDSKSGVSGAGRSLKTQSLFSEVSEGLKPYNIMNHRHQPEIEEQLSSAAGISVSITFAPHLVPMNRGIISTIYVRLKHSTSAQTIQNIFNKYYKKEQFVRILPEGTLPSTGFVRGSNYCDIGFCLQGKKLILVSAIDNLVKGASGQAVQNMNIMQGFKEATALEHIPLYP